MIAALKSGTLRFKENGEIKHTVLITKRSANNGRLVINLLLGWHT